MGTGRKVLAAAGLIAALGALSAGLSGCSTVRGIFRGDDATAAARQAPGADDPYPSLGSVPDRPVVAETKEQRREIARGLVADRDRVQYTDQLLRGGTDIPAPPPPPPLPSAAATPEATGSTANAAAAETPKAARAAKAEDSEPGFFGRLFGRKAKKTASDAPEPLPAQPSGAVEVAPVGALSKTGAASTGQ